MVTYCCHCYYYYYCCCYDSASGYDCDEDGPRNSDPFLLVPFLTGPYPQMVYTLAPKYPYKGYFKAKVYTTWVHGPSRIATTSYSEYHCCCSDYSDMGTGIPLERA